VAGIARVGQVDGARVRLDLFESADRPTAQETWVKASEVRRRQIGLQTRVFWRDRVTGRWMAGRVIGGGPAEYFVRQPNAEEDLRVAEADLRVRWHRPLRDPLGVL